MTPASQALVAAAARRHTPDPGLVRMRAAAHWAAETCPVVAQMIDTGPPLHPHHHAATGWYLAAEQGPDRTLTIWICGNAILASDRRPGAAVTRTLPLPETLRKAPK